MKNWRLCSKAAANAHATTKTGPRALRCLSSCRPHWHFRIRHITHVGLHWMREAFDCGGSVHQFEPSFDEGLWDKGRNDQSRRGGRGVKIGSGRASKDPILRLRPPGGTSEPIHTEFTKQFSRCALLLGPQLVGLGRAARGAEMRRGAAGGLARLLRGRLFSEDRLRADLADRTKTSHNTL